MSKRVAAHVPYEVYDRIAKLTKADLMEIAYSFAEILEGEGNVEAAIARIDAEYRAIAACYGRPTPARL